MTDKEKKGETKPTIKEYPKDVEITSENAVIEIAKDIREIRNFTRNMRVTDGRRIGVASYISGITPAAKRAMMSDLIAAITGKAKTDVLKQQKQVKEMSKKIEQ